MRKLLFGIISICLSLSAFSQQNKQPALSLPALVGDNMVLQQSTEINVWGSARPGKKVEVSASWNVKENITSDENGKWLVKIKTPVAGGPYTISISTSDSTITLKNILIGEVWFCSGQSNMEMPLAGWPPHDTIMYSASEIASANYSQIRIFSVQHAMFFEPGVDYKGQWLVCSPSTVAGSSATAWFFGKNLYKELNIPIGLIESAWGGTPVESWIDEKSLQTQAEFISVIKENKEKLPRIDAFSKWVKGHKKLDVPAGDENIRWKNLDFNDANCAYSNFDDTKWPLTKLPQSIEKSAIGEFDGVVWYRRSFDVPATMLGQDLNLNLGPIDDMDRVYINGELVGTSELPGFWQVERKYTIPARLLKTGSNIIAVRVIDQQGGGGLWGTPEQLKITAPNQKNESVLLSGEWRFQPVAECLDGNFYIYDYTKQEFFGMERPGTLSPSMPTVLYNGMVNPAINYVVKGAIWYQGEANVGRAEQYSRLFPLMINNWREVWKNKNMPFYFVQIAPYNYSQVDAVESGDLRNAQLSALKIPNTGVVSTLDVAVVENIHPPFKKEVGERLSFLALSNAYGKVIPYSGPLFKSMKRDGNKLIIQFNCIEKGLKAGNDGLTEFEVAGNDGRYFKATAAIVNNELVVFSEEVAEPVAVRYAYRNGAKASLFNSVGLPAPTFSAKL